MRDARAVQGETSGAGEELKRVDDIPDSAAKAQALVVASSRTLRSVPECASPMPSVPIRQVRRVVERPRT